MPLITISLFLLMFLVPLVARDNWMLMFNAPAVKYHNQWWRVFSYIFIHRSHMHLFTNLVFLVVMGYAYEARLGELSWLLMLLFVLAVAMLAQFPKMFSADSTSYSGFSNVNSGLIVAALLTGDVHAGNIPVGKIVVAGFFAVYIMNLPRHHYSAVDHQGHFFGACAGLIMYKLNLSLI